VHDRRRQCGKCLARDMASTSTVGCRPASRRVDDRHKRRLRGQRGVAAASSLRGRTRTTLPTAGTSRARTARAATWPRCPACGWRPRAAAQLPHAVHLEPDHATAAPRALATVHDAGGDAKKRPTSPRPVLCFQRPRANRTIGPYDYIYF
jgi:hypothetical protein